MTEPITHKAMEFTGNTPVVSFADAKAFAAAAVLAERERCAAIADAMDDGYEQNQAGKVAAAIRRGDQP